MTTLRTAKAAALTLAVLVAVGAPGIELWLDCRVPDSEGCVWGKALWPVSFGAGAIVGAALGLAAYLAFRAWHRHAGAGDGEPS